MAATATKNPPKGDQDSVNVEPVKVPLDPTATPGVIPDESDLVGQAISNVHNLIQAKRKIQADIQAGRDFLNQAVRINIANEAQAKWVTEHLPKRTRKGKSDSNAE